MDKKSAIVFDFLKAMICSFLKVNPWKLENCWAYKFYRFWVIEGKKRDGYDETQKKWMK